jgi:hypothetical protein
MRTRRDVLRLGAALGACGLGTAGALEVPGGPVVLTISGRVMSPNAGPVADFDMSMLERLPQTSFTTKTPWYGQPRQFTGPLVRELLSRAGAQGTTLRMRALNDYRVDVPYEDAQRYDLIVARLLDGQPMPVRDKGPLFAVYPFDAQPELRNAVYYSRSAWQLRSIEVR